MRILLFFALFFCSPLRAADVFLPEDEIILPPYLNTILNHGDPEERFNVMGIGQHKRQVKVHEWLDYGDELDLPGRVAFEVLQRETIQWVGGGVFQGKIGAGPLLKDEQTYELTLTRGWIKVWVRPDPNHYSMRILTDAGNLRAKEAIFWLNTRPGHTEIYLLSGELLVESTKIPLANRAYATFEKGKDKPIYISREWDVTAMEVKIAAAYPFFVKLSTTAQEAWEAKRNTRIYAVLRKKGWRKASRLEPTTK
jgi:hypothetical protein